MANEVCVFCGQKPGPFRSTFVTCGNTQQPACKTCANELEGLEEAELCRRALVRGIAENPERLRERIAVITEAESHRPKCPSCGEALTFLEVQDLDNSPMRDSLFTNPFSVLPACCSACGRYVFYNPDIVRKNKHLAHLIRKDTRK